MIVLALLLLFQSEPETPKPEATPLPIEQVDAQIKEIATLSLSSSFFLTNVMYADSKIRAEIRRVGLPNGCTNIYKSSKEVVSRHTDRLLPIFVEVTRKAGPWPRLSAAENLAMLGGRLTNDIENSTAAPVLSAQDDMRRTFLSYTQRLPKIRDKRVNRIKPSPEVAKAFGAKGNWNLDDSIELAMACSEHSESSGLSPKLQQGKI
jgi:hypothetical protein